MKKYGGLALIAALAFGLLFFVTGTRECGPVPAGLTEDSAGQLVASGDTLASIDPRMGVSSEFHCIGGLGENWPFALLGAVLLLGAIGFLIVDWRRKARARKSPTPEHPKYPGGGMPW